MVSIKHITTEERVMREQDFIVSKTDSKGRITYCNRTFIEFSGYSESELLGASHNIIRHPDMPKGVFKLMWETLQQGHEFFGYIKNSCKDGGLYWTFANATPSLDAQGKLLGYFSVRRKPVSRAIESLEPLYQAMLEEERRKSGGTGIEASVKLLEQAIKEQGGDGYENFILAL